MNDKFNVDNTVIDGRVIGGSNQDFQLVSGMKLTAPTPEPASTGLIGLGLVSLLSRRRRPV